MKIVTFDSVAHFYQGKAALAGLSLEILDGERVVVLGPSGCGKTTLLRLIAGFIAPDRGSITLAGELAARDGSLFLPPEKRNLGMVFQDLALWPHFTIWGNIEFGLKTKGLPKQERTERVESMLALTGLSELSDRKPGELSGGQQQRVALARALAPEPRILLMDEPLSSLDPDLNRRLRGEILGLQQKLGFTLLYVTHNRDEAFDMATRVVLMSKEKIEYQGTVPEAQTYLQPRTDGGKND